MNSEHDTPQTDAFSEQNIPTIKGEPDYEKALSDWVDFSKNLEKALINQRQISKKYEDRYFAATELLSKKKEALEEINERASRLFVFCELETPERKLSNEILTLSFNAL